MSSRQPDEKKIALVTGANKGIGREVVVQLAGLGMAVFLGARDAERRKQAAEEISATGAEVYPVELDVTKPETAHAAAEEIERAFGRLDILVNNAGIGGDVQKQQPSTADTDMVRELFETNYFGVLTVTNAMIPLLLRSSAGRIVNVTSGLGSLANMTDPNGYMTRLPPVAGYIPSKTALNSLTVQYSKELRDCGILVNAADPGACDTDFTKGKGFAVQRTAAQGASVAVGLATLGPDGPTGRVFADYGPVPW